MTSYLRIPYSLLLVFLLCLSVLTGCNAPDSELLPTEPSVTPWVPVVGASFGETLSDNDLPPVASSLILSDALTIAPWNSDRCERSSYCSYGESETGIYVTANMSLHYAEKTDLDNWVVVCPNPDCKHAIEPDGCPASVDGNFILRDNRIYYPGRFAQYRKIWMNKPETSMFMFLASMAMDGSETQLEHTFDVSGISLSNGYGGSMYVSSDYAIYCRIVLNDNGLYDTQIFILDEYGEHLVYDEDLDYNANGGGYVWALNHNTFGDRMFLCGILDPTWQIPFILTEDYTIEQVDLTGLPEEGAYLSDNIYRCFRANDGYYDVNLETREETKLEEAQLENSHAFVVLPNCILESTLMGYTSLPMQSNAQQNAMKLFDGQRWWDVELPEELLEVKGKYLDVEAITSDRILLRLQESKDVILYQIFLGTDRPVMEYAGTVEYQELPESW